MSRSRRNLARGKVICKKWIYLERHIFHRRQLIAKVSFRDGGVEGCALIFFSKNTKIATNDHQQENVGSHQKKDTPHPRAKENPQQDARRGAIMFKIKSQTRQRCLEGANTTLYAPGPKKRNSDPPQETEPDLCLSVSCRDIGWQ